MFGQEASGNTAQRAVLVVEDEVLVRLSLAEALRASGFRVIEAANGYEAKAILQSSNPVAVMVTDVKMPGIMDGVSLSKWVRDSIPSVKIVLVSGTIPYGAQTLADAVFAKPYDTDALVRRVAQLMRNGPAPPDVECA